MYLCACFCFIKQTQCLSETVFWGSFLTFFFGVILFPVVESLWISFGVILIFTLKCDTFFSGLVLIIKRLSSQKREENLI